MQSTMRAYDGLAFETTHSCIGRIAQRSRGGGSETSGNALPEVFDFRGNCFLYAGRRLERPIIRRER
jgi:hypothetical protein